MTNKLIVDTDYAVWDNSLNDFIYNVTYVGSIFVGEELHLFQTNDGDFYTINENDLNTQVKNINA